MKKIILLLYLILSISYSNAQTGNRDSIKQLLQNDTEDTSRVLHLADLSFEYTESKPDTTMKLALQALELSRLIGFLKGEAVSLNRVGNAYHTLGNYPKAMEVFLQALQINEKVNNLDGKQKNLGNIGLIYNEQEDYRQALNYYFEAKTLAEQLNNQRSLSIACIPIGQHMRAQRRREPGDLILQTLGIVRISADDGEHAQLVVNALSRQTRQQQCIARAMRQRKARALAGFGAVVQQRMEGSHRKIKVRSTH